MGPLPSRTIGQHNDIGLSNSDHGNSVQMWETDVTSQITAQEHGISHPPEPHCVDAPVMCNGCVGTGFAAPQMPVSFESTHVLRVPHDGRMNNTCPSFQSSTLMLTSSPVQTHS